MSALNSINIRYCPTKITKILNKNFFNDLNLKLYLILKHLNLCAVIPILQFRKRKRNEARRNQVSLLKLSHPIRTAAARTNWMNILWSLRHLRKYLPELQETIRCRPTSHLRSYLSFRIQPSGSVCRPSYFLRSVSRFLWLLHLWTLSSRIIIKINELR